MPALRINDIDAETLRAFRIACMKRGQTMTENVKGYIAGMVRDAQDKEKFEREYFGKGEK